MQRAMAMLAQYQMAMMMLMIMMFAAAVDVITMKNVAAAAATIVTSVVSAVVVVIPEVVVGNPEVSNSATMSNNRVPKASYRGPRNGAFGKPCPCPRDTRHFRHFRRFTGFEQQNPCFTG